MNSAIESILKELSVTLSDVRPLFKEDEHPIPSFTVAGKDVRRAWEMLHDSAEHTGYWPVIMGGRDKLLDLPRKNVGRILRAAESIQVKPWLARRAMNLELQHRWDQEKPQPWPSAPPNTEVAVSTPWEVDPTAMPNFRMRLREQCLIVLVPTTDCTELPAYIQIGDFNECPAPDYHVAMLRYWNERYDLHVIALTHDVMEVLVRRPPQSREEFETLATEQYHYCNDNVDQGAGSLHDLAVGLWQAPSWYFWWD